MNPEYQILAAFGLDLLLGDPRRLPHPVKLIGRFALVLEAPLRRRFTNLRAAGIAAAVLVVGSAGLITWAAIRCAAFAHPVAGDVISILLLYTTFAARDLLRHSHKVYKALQADDIRGAREAVAMLVGRDTKNLDEGGVSRAAVESVAENLIDGVTAPIFFAALGGPVAAIMYKAASTLDSTFGYKTERYLFFGWASARLDDALNYLPARLTVPFIAIAAAVSGFRPFCALRVCLRDGRKHSSPNAGLGEAAVAGALGLQLGGLNYYDGEPEEGALLGDPVRRLGRRSILSVNILAFITAVLFLLACVAMRGIFAVVI
ncbi:MAG: adenosylcobinamide-phosphate synthase CbiB [Acidobacteriota bacterium]|jgi:adenosylcobinamide-phosphate synthase|nr:adenosylcobinamide-phosphate synthase CbiB [Acidobacteriota bacterium]